MDRALADLIRISREVGSDLALVQGGGGNTSVKTADGQFMYVKASGTALKDMSETRGWRRLRLAPVLDSLCDPALAALAGTSATPRLPITSVPAAKTSTARTPAPPSSPTSTPSSAAASSTSTPSPSAPTSAPKTAAPS